MNSKQQDDRPARPARILVVDDEPFMQRLIEIILERDGYEVLRAAHGGEALQVALTERPDVILMDAMMPKVDGLTALRELKAEAVTQSIPVIILTANPNKFSPEEAVASGATRFMTKPFSPTQLLSEVRRVLRP